LSIKLLLRQAVRLVFAELYLVTMTVFVTLEKTQQVVLVIVPAELMPGVVVQQDALRLLTLIVLGLVEL
jgi:hypothetical protein